MQNAVFELTCVPQQYAWGKIGSTSPVAQFMAGSDSNFSIEEDKPYAELWMGTHHKAPSVIKNTGEDLGKWIAANPDSLSAKIREQFGDKLPFLFKILSINKALSIQAHPDKKRAEQFHAADPEHYGDDNHKPEMAVAITPMEGMCGFRLPQEMAGFLETLPELRAVIGEAASVAFIAAASSGSGADQELRACFDNLMHAEPELVKVQLATLVVRVSASAEKSQLDELLLRLDTQYPGGDVGCFVIYVLNIVHLAPGEAMFLSANEPHAYLFGDCVECMATSDNVVRAGLTPKFKDADRLVEMLTYRTGTDEDNKRYSVREEGAAVCASGATVFRTPIPEFDIARLELAAGQQALLGQVEGPSIFIVTGGSASAKVVGSGEELTLAKGSVHFAANGADVDIVAGSDGLLLFRAFCEL